MKIGYLLLIILSFSCSTPRGNRLPASIDTQFYFDEVDREKSMVKLFPPENDEGVFHYYFYLELRNKLGRYTDIDLGDLELRLGKKKKVEFHLERQLRGRYYVKVDTSEDFVHKQIDVYVGGKPLKEKFELSMAPVSKKMSKLKLIRKYKNRAHFQLFIADKTGKGIEIPSSPEIIVEPDGQGEIENLTHLKQGVWEFTMTYPEHNVILYINVRAHGVFLEHLYRFHHVEKDKRP